MVYLKIILFLINWFKNENRLSSKFDEILKAYRFLGSKLNK